MKRLIPFLILMGVCTPISFGAFDFTISGTTYEGGIFTLNNQSLLVTGGGANIIEARGSSYVEVQNTAPLQINVGGIYTLDLMDTSELLFSGGEMAAFHIWDSATATLCGGTIEHLASHQNTNIMKHITIIYSGDLPTWSSTTNILTGLWGNDDPFSIQLHDVDSYDPTINNIQFQLIPEPATICLMGFGLLLLKKRRTS